MRRTTDTQIIVFCMSAHAAAHICEQIFPAIAPLLIKEGFATLTEIGDLGAIFPIFFGFLALPAGFLVDRLGSRRMLYAYLVGAGIAGLAATLSPTKLALAIAMGMMGAAAALYHPAGLSLLSKRITQSGRAFGLHGVGGSIGLATGPFLAGGLVGATFGWRWGFLVAAIPCLALAVYVRGRELNDSNAAADDPAAPEDPPELETQDRAGRAKVAILPVVLILGMGLFNGFVYRGFLTFSPLYLTDHFQQSFIPIDPVTQANILVSLALFAGIWGQLIGGRWADRFREEKVILACIAGSMVMLVAIGSLVNAPLVIAMLLFSFIHFAIQPLSNKLLAGYTPESFRGKIYGIAFFVAFGLGSFSSAIMGRLGDRFGVEYIFLTLAAVCVGALILAFTLLLRARATQGRALTGSARTGS